MLLGIPVTEAIPSIVRPFSQSSYPLTGIRVYKDDQTGEMTIEFFCDEAGEDIFRFQIITGLTDEGIGKLTKIGKLFEERWE